jgi:hypothetical protein
MELGWSTLALICIAAAGVWFWQDSLASREAANAAALDACGRLGLQLLDGTVAFARLSFARDVGRLTLRRTYVFDYTANSIERRQGFVVLLGRRVESVGYARDEDVRLQQVRSAQQAEPSGAPTILQLDDWRTRSARARGAQAPGTEPRTRDQPREP